MTFISYARNFEDVMLWRALKGVDNGFYIDICSTSPTIHSVTKSFCERGWQGVTIELNPESSADLSERSARNKNFCTAASDEDGTRCMGLSAPIRLIHDVTFAQENADACLTIEKLMAQKATIAELWKQYVPEECEVHFLRIDVEGFEEAVFMGNDWSKCRPWIIVIAATSPAAFHENYKKCKDFLLSKCYSPAYADGLNRFYLSDEHTELSPAFEYPLNISDDFKMHAHHIADVQLQTEKKCIDGAMNRIYELQNEVDRLSGEISIIYSSRSWRFSKPLRIIFTAWLRLFEIFRPIQGSMRNTFSSIVAYSIRFLRAHPACKEIVLHLLCRYPILHSKIRKFAFERGMLYNDTSRNNPFNAYYLPSFDLAKLTPDARRIYMDLKSAIEQHNEGDR